MTIKQLVTGLLLLGCLFHPCIAADLPADSSQVRLRIPDTTRISELQADKDFAYLQAAGSSYSWWEYFWQWLGRQLSRMFQEGEGGSFWGFFLSRVLPWALVIAAALLLILKVLGMDLDNFLRKKPVSADVPFRETAEDIRQIDFGSRIEEALLQRNFRLAIRLYYLDALQQLSGAGLIQWHPEKTNRHYFREIGNQEVKNRFGRLTHLFEYVWYGEFDLPETHFEAARKEFLGLKGIIGERSL